MATGLNGPYVPWSMNSEDGRFLDRMFRPVGDGNGLGSADPQQWSAAAIKLIEPRFKKYQPDSFRNAVEHAASRELKRRAEASNPLNPPPGLFHQGPPPPPPPPPAGASADPIADAIDQLDQLSLKHNWNLIKEEFEDDEGEKFFAMGQIPWATSADQLTIEMSLGGRSCKIMKKTSTGALKPGVLLKAFFSDTSGNAIHGKNDTHTIAFKKAVKDMRAKSDDPSACVSSETVYFPWEADRKFDEFLIREVFVDGRHEVWMYLRVKRVGNLYEPAPETPAVPLGQPSFGGSTTTTTTNNTTATTNNTSTGTGTTNDAMDTDDSRTKRSRSMTAKSPPGDPGPTPGVPTAASMPPAAGTTTSTADTASTAAVVPQQVSLADILAYMKKMETNQLEIVEEVKKQKSENEGFQTAVAERFSRVSINAATMDLLNRLDPRNTGIPQQLPPLQLPGQPLQAIGYQGYGPQQEAEVDPDM